MEDAQSKAKEYSDIKNRVFFFNLLLSIFLLIFLQLSGISAWLKLISTNYAGNFFVINVIYATLFGLIFYVAGIPLSFYKGYVIEHRFGLSNQNLVSWLKDLIKKALISYIIFVLFFEFLYIFLRRFPSTWWIWMAGAWVLFGIVFAKLVPVLIIPLFFKYTELKDNELKTKLIGLAQQCGVKILNVFKIDLSAKTNKANAALTGIGNTRRILLSDTLLKKYTKEEIEVVLAHELAHHRFGHIWKTLVFGGLSTAFGFYLINISLKTLIGFLGLKTIYDIEAFPLILLFLTIFSIAMLPIQNFYSRRMENQADYFAVKLTKLSDDFISCMNKLARQNLANVSPSRFIEIMLYDHPPISKRIDMVSKMTKNEKGGRE